MGEIGEIGVGYHPSHLSHQDNNHCIKQGGKILPPDELANLQNARLSTGPTTTAGNVIVATQISCK